jgi:hypothetical protein
MRVDGQTICGEQREFQADGLQRDEVLAQA